jgi:NADPH-dependent 2,4-dienoyl-CoA reductase/sulfur reductase-like enzyme
MATSKPNIFAAGEMTGISGAHAALQGGTLAGLGAAETLGFIHPRLDSVRRRARAALRRDTHFAQGLMVGFPVPRGLDALMSGDTLACRCEEVSCNAVREALAEGAGNAAGVKMWTRAGMGLCQGRVCSYGLARLVDTVSGSGLAAAGSNPPHIPLRPVPLSIVEDSLRSTGNEAAWPDAVGDDILTPETSTGLPVCCQFE